MVEKQARFDTSLCDGRKGHFFYLLAIRRVATETGILPITERDLILTDGADELRCAAGFLYSCSAENLKTFSWAFFPITI